MFSPGQAVGLDQLLTRLEADEFDLVAVGRALIANPDWASRVKNGDFEGLAGFDSALLAKL